MAEKNLTTRIKHKTDTSANWAKAVNFVPLKGEIIVYSDLRKIKVGDGTTKVNSLEFLADSDTHQPVVDKNPTLNWGTKSTVATIGDTSINVTMPANPNSHQPIKTLKTDNTAAQATSASEAIAGSGTINLHKVAKTGSYNDLSHKPTIPDTDNLVPYTGATKDVKLSNHTLTVSSKGIEDDDVCCLVKSDEVFLQDPGSCTGYKVGKIDCFGLDVYLPNYSNMAPSGAEFFAKVSDITSHAGIDKVGTVTSVNGKLPEENGNVTLDNNGWEYVGRVAQTNYTIDLSEIKPGHSGTTTGAKVYVDIHTFKKALGGITQYKTVLDVTCRTNPFNLKHLDLKALLSNVGSKWFFPRVLITRAKMNSPAYTHMMAVLYADRANVGMTIDEISIFRDMTTTLGTLNAGGGVLPIGSFNADGFSLFAVMMELDRDNAEKNVTVTGSHHKVTLFHPNPVL